MDGQEESELGDKKTGWEECEEIVWMAEKEWLWPPSLSM